MMLALQTLAWLVALAWIIKVIEAARGLPKIVDLRDAIWNQIPKEAPSLAIIVPARNEEENVEACLRSLLDQDYPALRIIAVNDRSTDRTGQIMAALAQTYPERLSVLTIEELPAEWLGKTHAMARGAELAGHVDWLLFTDADVVFRSDTLRRSLSYGIAAKADHLVTMPTTITKGWDEAMILALLQIFAMWATRPWKIADPKSLRDAIGIGAFNLIRREAYEQVGGFAALRMAVIEDLGLGRRVKQEGLAQRIAFGRGMVNIHWATGAMGLVRVMTKNMFSAFNFHLSLAAVACLWLAFFCIAPFVSVWMPGFQLPSVLAVLSLWFAYRIFGKTSGIPSTHVLLAPAAASLLIYAAIRSAAVTLWQGGIVWRGTFYPLEELRRHAAPFRNRKN